MSEIWENEEILNLMREFIGKASKNGAVCECKIDMDSKAVAIKKRLGNKDIFDDYEGTNEYLLTHQKAGVLIAEIFDRYAFYYDTGTGKTVLALEIIAQKEREASARFLIICPKTIVKSAWLDDVQKFYPNLKILPLSKNITIEDYKKIYRQWNLIDADMAIEDKFIDGSVWEKGSMHVKNKNILDRLLPRAKHYIVNPETFKLEMEFYKSLRITGLIVDESAMLKNYYSKTSSFIRQFSSDVKYVYLLSGKPAPNSELEYFPQMKIINPKTFHMSFEKYKEKYYEEDPFNQNELIFKSTEYKEKVIKLIGERSIILSKEDCLKLPEKTYQTRKLELPSDVRDKYESMLYDFYLEVCEEENVEKTITVINKLASLMKLRQITSGFIIDNKDPLFIHDIKEKELVDVLNDIGDRQVIIWCQFNYEINRIVNIVKKMNKIAVTAYGGTKDVDNSIKSFKEGYSNYMIAHPRTLQYGVTLTNCSYAIYYSLSYSHEQYYQSHDRIYRKGQKNACTYIFLQAENTIDERIFDVVQNKKSDSELFEMLIKDAKSLGIFGK